MDLSPHSHLTTPIPATSAGSATIMNNPSQYSSEDEELRELKATVSQLLGELTEPVIEHSAPVLPHEQPENVAAPVTASQFKTDGKTEEQIKAEKKAAIKARKRFTDHLNINRKIEVKPRQMEAKNKANAGAVENAGEVQLPQEARAVNDAQKHSEVQIPKEVTLNNEGKMSGEVQLPNDAENPGENEMPDYAEQWRADGNMEFDFDAYLEEELRSFAASM
ncbi:hypothetical protein QBC40DRAFT_291621 [Triangularia verruculosa]|uniref:Uncharacterized protein n=1 Tax=Triangularia verruculosa TaxID=2587418 RepID=A0AAN6XS50_9PEZI|nr:hypothetical protein QBC40DRAFT_291621 [Triangularia verruculosa]